MEYYKIKSLYLNNPATYGKRRVVNVGKYLGLLLTIICLLTPGTNWALFYVKKLWNKKVWVNVE